MPSPSAASSTAAPELEAEFWFHSPGLPSLAALRGRVVFVLAFQMLCPGCVATALPQAQAVRRTFTAGDVAVLGLHTVFEHHEAQGNRAALSAFLDEYQIEFPVGIDAGARPGALPATMGRYGMQGTPTILLIDHHGILRLNHFGHVEDLALGALIGSLVAEKRADDEAAPKS